MNNNSILLVDPNFEPTNSKNLNLLVKIGIDTFSYAISDCENKLLHAVYDEQECENGYQMLQEKLKTDAYLKLEYHNVSVAAHTQNIISIPEELFDEGDVKQYSKFFEDAAVENIYVESNFDRSIQNIFALPKSVEKLVDANWQNSKKLLQNAGLIELASKLGSDSMIIDFTVGSFHLCYVMGGKINFSQSYQFEHVEELTYYILLIIKQLNVEIKQVALKTCGIIHEGDPKWNVLAQYFSRVEFLVAPSELNTQILDDMPAHYYTSLLALQQCG